MRKAATSLFDAGNCALAAQDLTFFADLWGFKGAKARDIFPLRLGISPPPSVWLGFGVRNTRGVDGKSSLGYELSNDGNVERAVGAYSMQE